jgi:hypothetical protein
MDGCQPPAGDHVFHRPATLTAAIYSHVDAEDLRDAVGAIAPKSPARTLSATSAS